MVILNDPIPITKSNMYIHYVALIKLIVHLYVILECEYDD